MQPAIFWACVGALLVASNGQEIRPDEPVSARIPFGTHINFGDLPTQMVIMWQTETPTNLSVVEYGLVSPTVSGGRPRRVLSEHAPRFPEQALGVQYNNTNQNRNTTVHKVVLEGLKQGAYYTYRVGDPSPGAGFSGAFFFTAMRTQEAIADDALRLISYCDMGDRHGLTIPDVEEDIANNFYDGLLHCGDLAYDLASDLGVTGDNWLRDIEPIAANLPYMVSPGNHEAHYNFSNFRQRFSMPMADKYESMYYSFDIGPAHIVSYNTEVFFWPQYFDEGLMKAQFEWLDQDLKAANAHRDERPWIIVMGHRPMYCLVADRTTGQCDHEHEASRRGIPSNCGRAAGFEDDEHLCTPTANSLDTYPIEDLFYRHGVDLAIFGHVHDYERFLPVYNESVPKVTDASNPYFAPKAPVHITTGSGGNPEMPYGAPGVEPPHGGCSTWSPWCAYYSGYFPHGDQPADFTYSHVTVHNSTHLHFSQWSSIFRKWIDEIWIVQPQHGSFAANEEEVVPLHLRAEQ